MNPLKPNWAACWPCFRCRFFASWISPSTQAAQLQAEEKAAIAQGQVTPAQQAADSHTAIRELQRMQELIPAGAEVNAPAIPVKPGSSVLCNPACVRRFTRRTYPGVSWGKVESAGLGMVAWVGLSLLWGAVTAFAARTIPASGA